jgi:predicted AAA+ superfamily ATPase
MIKRELFNTVLSALSEAPAVCLVGPRQAGKTTLALEVAAGIGGQYLDLESETDRAKLADPEAYLARHLDKLVIENLLSAAPEGTQAFYYRTSGGAEIDLLLERPGGALWAVEVKRSSAPSVSRGFHAACADLRPVRRFVVYPGTEAFPLPGEVEALPPVTLMNRLTETAGHR